jgi:hypothetical protein
LATQKVFFYFFKPRVVNVDISVSQRLHWDINGDNGRADVVTLAVGWCDKSGRQKAQREQLEQGRGFDNTGNSGWENLTRASNEQRTAGSCCNDGCDDAIPQTTGGG